MASSNAVTEIGKFTDKYIFTRQLPQDNYFVYLQMACNAYRDIMLRHSNEVVTAKVAVNALGIVEMPDDMVGFSNLFVPFDGEWFSFTFKRRKVTTTTMVGSTETQDSTMGEGVDVHDAMYLGYGAKGGVSDYYLNINWASRRLFLDGMKSDTAVLQYTSSGLTIGGSTFIPQQCESVLTAYIDWQKEINATRSMAMLQTLERYYTDEVFKLRMFNWLPSRDEIADAWDSTSTQTVLR
jgi:hypothetical protein